MRKRESRVGVSENGGFRNEFEMNEWKVGYSASPL